MDKTNLPFHDYIVLSYGFTYFIHDNISLVDSMQIIFSNRAYLSILSETSEKIKTETGGIFLGGFENGNWYVIEAIDPGLKSVFHVAYFEYDQKYTTHLINKIARLYQTNLTLIGLWHRHPGSFDEFSKTDNGTNSEYAKMTSNGAISVLVNIDPEFRMTPYHVTWPLCYTKITYKVGDDFIPNNFLQMKSVEQTLDYINGYADRSYSEKNLTSKTKVDFVRLINEVKSKFEAVQYDITNEDINPEEAKKYRDLLIDSLIDDITYLTETRGLVINVEQNNGYICLSHKGTNNTITKVYFMYIPKREQIVFSYGDVYYVYAPKMFSNLLANYDSLDNSLKSGLIRALSLGRDSREGLIV